VVTPARGFVHAIRRGLGGLARELARPVEVAGRLLARDLGQLARLLGGVTGQPGRALGGLLRDLANLAQGVVDDDLHLVRGGHASIVAPRQDVCVDEKPEGVPADVRRRIDEVFGDVLPDVTRDEVDEHRPSNDDALLEDRPPHHDRD
jgi:hypothetical protein